MSLWTNGRPMPVPEINHRRAVFALGRINGILSREKGKEQEKDGNVLGSRNALLRTKIDLNRVQSILASPLIGIVIQHTPTWKCFLTKWGISSNVCVIKG